LSNAEQLVQGELRSPEQLKICRKRLTKVTAVALLGAIATNILPHAGTLLA
jgi:hypothetical protein